MESENQEVLAEVENQFEQEIDDSLCYTGRLDQYLNYQRQPFHPRQNQELYLMNCDVVGTIQSKYTNQEIENQNGQIKRVQYTKKIPLLQIYCTTKNGNSVCVNIRDFRPYFYAKLPSQISESRENILLIKDKLNARMKSPNCITDIEIVERMSLRFYQPEQILKDQKFMKIYLVSQAYVPELRKIFESGEHLFQGIFLPRETFQSNIPYLLRFMIDKQIVGMGWFKVNPGYQIVPQQKKMTRCQLQINASVDLVQKVNCQGPWSILAPQRILSFDIQCAAEHGFPSPQRDPVIQIACVCKSSHKDIEDYKVVFVLDGATPISGVHIKNMKNERQMLEDFQKLVITYDPDFIIGYNVINFDMKYLIQRSKTLKMKDYGFFGRNLKQLSKVSKGKFQSKVMGMRQTFQINTDGRIQLDLLIHMHRDHKLTSYRLNNVSFQFLGDQKEDVHHSEITKLFKQSMDGRKRLAIYCLKDAQLPLRLMEKLCCLYNYSEMARVTGVPINFLLTRGQQIKVVSQILRKAAKKNYIMPTQRVKNGSSEVAFEGAYVLDPKPGFYEQPIATLDFASLYPSIMMAYNLCYTTLIKKSDIERLGLTKEDVHITPQGHYFVKQNKKSGLLPQILNQLITARKKAKKQLAQTKDQMLQKVLDGRQLALKISANSVYGFTGATVGQLPCLEISSSVTSYGRRMIEQTKNKVIQVYGADVIYGDTDSVMVKFKLETTSTKKEDLIKQAMSWGTKAASTISQLFPKPIKLQFEKVYFPYLLITKKRYAGVYYTRPQKHDKIDKKGIQAVRRDNCLLIRQMIEKVLETILVEGDKKKAIKQIQDKVAQLLQNKIDISKLTITKAISKQMEEQNDEGKKENKKAYKSKQAHTELAQKMKKRDENISINIGDRIPYVMISGMKGSKNYENAEDPTKVLQQDLPIDYDYYINKQIKPPLERLLKLTGIIDNTDILFSGEHTKLRYAPKVNQKSVLGQYLKKKETCLGCKRQSAEAVCSNCYPKKEQIFLKKQEQHLELKHLKSKLNAQCNQCQRFITNKVLCENFDCPIYYRRIKVNKDLENKQKQVKRFLIPYW